MGVCRPIPTIIEEETPSLLHLVERGKKNVVRVSRASCVEWSDARESVFMVCGRHPRRVLKLRSRKPDAVRKLSIHHSPLLFTSQTHVCSDTGAAHDQRRHTPGCSDGICANTQDLAEAVQNRICLGEVETPNLFRWLFDDVFEGVNLGVEVFWVCGLR